MTISRNSCSPQPLNRRSFCIVAQIGLNFLWCGTAYIIQVYRLLQFVDGAAVNLLSCGLYYLLQAAGIGAGAFLFAKRPAVAGGRSLPLLCTIFALSCTAAAVFSSSVNTIIAAGALLNLAIGVLSCCYLTRLATDIRSRNRGLAFGCAYACGSVGTWLLSLPLGCRFLWSSESIYAVALIAALALLLLRYLPPLPDQKGAPAPPWPGLDRGAVWLAAAVLFLMWLNNTLGFSFPLKSADGSVCIEFTRAFYAAGLIIAGLISDWDRRWGAICALASLAFPAAALALGGSVTGETLMWILAYFFLGFLATFRLLLFSDFSAKKALPALAVLGLAAGRLGEAVGTVGAAVFTGAPLIILSGTVFILVVVLFFPLYQKLYHPAADPGELEKRRALQYMTGFGLSAREQAVFSLIMEGMSNGEIAAALHITESTVKFHVSNIFKKTGFANRSELIIDFKLGPTPPGGRGRGM